MVLSHCGLRGPTHYTYTVQRQSLIMMTFLRLLAGLLTQRFHKLGKYSVVVGPTPTPTQIVNRDDRSPPRGWTSYSQSLKIQRRRGSYTYTNTPTPIVNRDDLCQSSIGSLPQTRKIQRCRSFACFCNMLDPGDLCLNVRRRPDRMLSERTKENIDLRSGASSVQTAAVIGNVEKGTRASDCALSGAV